LGHVYVCGTAQQASQLPYPLTQPPPIRFDTDSTQPFSNTKMLFVVQYDTAGILQWIRRPAPDSTNYLNQNKYIAKDMLVGKDGRVDLLCWLPKGLIGNANGGTALADTSQSYILSYDRYGNLIGLVKPELLFYNTILPNIRMARTRSGKYIVSGLQNFDNAPGRDTLVMGGQKVLNSGFVACYNSQWKLLWKRENSNTYSNQDGFFYRPVVDGNSNIYLVGTFFENNSSFNGLSLINTLSTQEVPYVVKLDSLGNNKWLKIASSQYSTMGHALALASNGRVYVAGAYGMVKWDNYTLGNPINGNYDVYLAGLDAETGVVVSLDSLKSSFGIFDFASTLVADNKGNVYVGGGMGYDLTVNGSTLYSDGGDNDFFIAKYGSANCATSLPLTLLQFSANMQGDNSVVLRWQTVDEGNTQSFIVERSTDGRLFAAVGNTAAAGTSSSKLDYAFKDLLSGSLGLPTLWYRLQMVDKDGRFTYSNIVAVATGISGKTGLAVYPLPSKSNVTIEYMVPEPLCVLEVYSADGRKSYGKQLTNGVGRLGLDVRNWASGVYMVLLKQDGIVVKTSKLVVGK